MAGLLYETHSHTPLCRHAVGQPEEYAAMAEKRGLCGIIFTCHNAMPDEFSSGVRMRVDEFEEYLDMVARTRDRWAGRVDVRLGLEADYFAGYESWLETQLTSADFHYVLGSIHPQIAEYRQRYCRNEAVEVQRTYFQLLADAAETGLFDAMAHPDLIKNQTPNDWRPTRIMDDIRGMLDRIAATGVAMELNTSGANKIIPEMNPFPEMLTEIANREIAVVVGADAHEPTRVGDRFESALDVLEECEFTHVSYFVDRVRHDVKIKDARGSLQNLDTNEL